MKELTDAMLSQDMGEFNAIAVIFPLIILILTLLIITKSYITKKNKAKDNSGSIQKEYKGYGYKMAIILILIIIAFLLFSIGNLFKNGENSNWYLTDEEVIEKREKTQVSDPGTRRTSYYIITKGDDEVLVTKDVYDRLNKGDKIYVLRRENGSSKKIYQKEEYTYTGNRLKENN